MKLVAHVPARELLKDLNTVEKLVSLGLGVELQLTSEVLDSFTFKDFGLIKKLTNGLPITVHAPFMDLNPGATEPYLLDITRKRFLQAVSAAKVLEAEVVVFHTGYIPQKVEPIYENWFKRALETFLIVGEEFKGKVALENVFDRDFKVILSFLERLPDNFGFCFDIGHFNIFSQIPLSDWFSSLSSKLYEFHLHDNLGSQDSHLPCGKGSFNFGYLFSLIESYFNEIPSGLILNLENKSVDDVKESLNFLRGTKWKEKLEFTRTKF